MPIGCRLLMLKADNEMHRVLADLVGCELGLEIEGAKGTVAASHRVKFRIEIINTVRLLIDQLQVGIAGPLGCAGSRSWEIAR